MKQGSEAWIELRRVKIGASDAPIIMQVSPWKSPLQLWEEKLGLRRPPIKTSYMQRGLDLEEEARQYFYVLTGIQVYPQVIFHKEHAWMMASVDGYNSKEKCLVEIKCPGKKDHQLALDGQIPLKYYPQLQHQMEVLNLNSAFYLSYDGQNGKILEIQRDRVYVEGLIKKEQHFWQCLENFLPPVT